MELQVGPLLREKGRSRTFSGNVPCPPDLYELGVQECRGPIRVEGQATHTGDGILVTGTVTAQVTLLCSRCLAPYPLAVEAAFQEEFVPRDRARAREADEQEAEASGRETGRALEDEVEFFQNNRIDLGPLVREQLLMAIPMKGVCREDCQGLCPVCGRNRNVEPCTCQVDETDPRLAVLRDLLEGGGAGTARGG